MNYFERLVRRARLMPAARPGAPLIDPFENVAEWPLETPAVSVAADAPRELPIAARVQTIEPEIIERILPPAHVPAMPGALEGPSQPAPVDTIVVTPPATQPVLPALVQESPPAPIRDLNPTPPPALLTMADTFMRGLGARLPDDAARPEDSIPIAPLLTESRQGVVAPTSKLPQAQRVSPPISQPRHISDRVADSEAHVESTGAPAPSAARQQNPQPTRIVETQRVVLVENSASVSRHAPIGGGGAPHFGLGQL